MKFVERNVGAWMHVDHGLGLYLYANANRRAPTNMHNNAISVNSMHRIRSAQDLALYNLTLTEEIAELRRHRRTWRPGTTTRQWQGVRETAEQLTATDDWCEAIFAANVVFEPLVGELFRSQLVQHAAPAQRRLRHADDRRCGRVRLRRARPALHQGHVRAADHRPRVRRPQQADPATSGWPPGRRGAIAAARTLQPLWSQPDSKPPRFEDGLDAVKNRFAAHPVRSATWTYRRSLASDHDQAESPFKSDNTASNQCGVTLMNNQVGAVVAEVMGEQGQRDGDGTCPR